MVCRRGLTLCSANVRTRSRAARSNVAPREIVCVRLTSSAVGLVLDLPLRELEAVEVVDVRAERVLSGEENWGGDETVPSTEGV